MTRRCPFAGEEGAARAEQWKRGYDDFAAGRVFSPPDGTDLDLIEAYRVGWRHADDDARERTNPGGFVRWNEPASTARRSP